MAQHGMTISILHQI